MERYCCEALVEDFGRNILGGVEIISLRRSA